MCGGYDALSLYRFDTGEGAPASPTYLGCYADEKRDRIMERISSGSSDVDNDVSIIRRYCKCTSKLCLELFILVNIIGALVPLRLGYCPMLSDATGCYLIQPDAVRSSGGRELIKRENRYTRY